MICLYTSLETSHFLLFQNKDFLKDKLKKKIDGKFETIFFQKESSLITTTTVTLDAVGKPIAATTNVTSGPQRKLNKSFSEPALDKYGSPATRMAGIAR